MSKDNENSLSFDELINGSQESIKEEKDKLSKTPVEKDTEENTQPSILEEEYNSEDTQPQFEEPENKNKALSKFVNKKQKERKKPKAEEPAYDPFSHIDEEPEQKIKPMQSGWVTDEEKNRNPENYKESDWNEGEGFTSILTMEETEEGLKGTNDHTDHVAKEYRKKQISVVFITVSVVMVIAAAIYVTLVVLNSASQIPEPPKTEETTQTTDNETEQTAISEASKYGTPESAIEGKITVTDTENVLETNQGNTLTITGAAFEKAENNCETEEESQFCLAGNFKIDGTELPTFFFHNIAKSRILETTQNIERTDISGFNENIENGGAFVAKVKLGPIETESIIVIYENQSGFMIQLNEGTPTEFISKIISLSKVS